MVSSLPTSKHIYHFFNHIKDIFDKGRAVLCRSITLREVSDIISKVMYLYNSKLKGSLFRGSEIALFYCTGTHINVTM